jgi:hypothetical protein
VWLTAHNHLPTPDLTYAGRGTRYDYGGTTVLASGGMTLKWCVNARCTPMAIRLMLHGNGNWSAERWAMNNTAPPSGCPTAAVLPASASRPGPWVGIPVETGP